MKLLLTGATGFVGRNVLLQALAKKYEVYAPVRSPQKLATQLRHEGFPDLPPGLTVLPVNPAEWGSIPFDRAILNAGVLFAREQEEYFSTNVHWTLSVLRALPEECRTTILSSQSAGGPTPPGLAQRTIGDPDLPITLYGKSKLAMEQAVRAEFPERPITILRPPMILGARDTATLPLFRMARGAIRIKPGLQTKTYSFLAVDDLVEALLLLSNAPEPPPAKTLAIAYAHPITDWQLMAGAAEAAGGRGVTVPIPQPLVRVLSHVVDLIPTLRAQIPSLTRDRAREIWPARWVVDATPFEIVTGWKATRGLPETLKSAYAHYVREGMILP